MATSLVTQEEINTFVMLCFNGQVFEIIEYLHDYGLELLKGQSSEGQTPLTVAVIAGQIKTVELLLNLGADVNEVDATGSSLLMWAIGMPNLVALLLKNKADANYSNSYGSTALTHAIISDDVESARLLLAAGALLDTGDVAKTAIARAKEKNQQEMLDLINEWGDKRSQAQRNIQKDISEARITALKEKRVTKPVFKPRA